MYVYVLCDPMTDEIRYVGLTTKSLECRLKGHLKWARSGRGKTHNTRWMMSLLTAGSSPQIFLIEEHHDLQELKTAEQFWIAYFRSIGCQLTNMNDGGEGQLKPTTETRENMSRSHIGLQAGEKHPLYGKKHTAQSKLLISMKRRGIATRPKGSFKWDGNMRDRLSAKNGTAVLCLEDGKTYSSLRRAAQAYGLNELCVGRVVRRKQKKTGGLTFVEVA